MVCPHSRYLLLLPVLSMLSEPAFGATVTWDGGAGTLSWNDANNWSANALPTSSDTVTLDALDVTINAAGATDSELDIASSQSASLTISNGKTLTSKYNAIGYGFGTTGTLTVSGSGSKLSSTNTVSVGRLGTGIMTIQNGGTVSDASGEISIGPITQGSVTVTDSGSKWTNSTSLKVGETIDGSLTVSNSANVTSPMIYIGYVGAGHVTVESGATVTNSGNTIFSYSYIDINNPSTLTVTGAGSAWTTTGAFVCADSGHSETSILDGGHITDTYAIIGQEYDFSTNTSSSGKMTVSGAGSTWTNNGYVKVGDAGYGYIAIGDGGLMSVTGSLIVANQAESIGVLAIGAASGEAAAAPGTLTAAKGITFGSGTGTLLFNHTSDNYTFGDTVTGSGTIEAQNGTTVFTGALTGFTGDYKIDGGALSINNGSDFAVFDPSGGGLLITSGTLTTASNAFVGNAVYSGSATVTGATSSWNNAGNLIVGDGNGLTGSLTIADGGKVSSSGQGDVGFALGSSGDVLVTGNGSSWSNAGLVLGDQGSGSLTIENGGMLSTTGSLIVGSSGEGILLISSGTASSASGASIGDVLGGTGTVSVTGASSAWTNTGTLVIGKAGTGAVTVSSGADLSSTGPIIIASQASSVGVLAIGGASGAAAAAAGTVNGISIDFGLGDGTLLFNHTSDNYVFSLNISGSGTIEAASGTTILAGSLANFTGTYNMDGGSLVFAPQATATTSSVLSGSGDLSFTTGKTVLTGNSGAFTGTTTVENNGTLSVNGTLGGSVDVANAGRLQGSGTIGDTSVQGNGTVAPGNSIGTLHVSGDISFAPGSTYEVEIADDGTSDKIEATGTATITGGNVVVIPYAGSYTAGTTYTILSAAGGVTGTFDHVSLGVPSLFLTTLLYDANDVYVQLVRNAASFASYAGTANQQGTARTIEQLGAGNALYDAVAALGLAEDARHVFQATDGELHANMKMSILENRFTETNALLSRLAQAQDFLNDGAALRVAANAESAAFWMQGYGQWNKRDGNVNAAPFKDQDQGAVVGADGKLGDHGRIGLAFGFGHTEAQQAASATGRGRADHYSLSAYGGQTFGALALRLGGSYGWQTIDTDRRITFPAYSDRLRASYDAQSGSVFAETSYGFEPAAGRRIEPFAGIAAGVVTADGFKETGGAAALNAQSAMAAQGATTLGLRMSQTLPYLNGANGEARLRASAAWRHAVGDTAPDNTFAFDGSAAFHSEGASLPRDAAQVGLGIDYAIGRSMTLGLSYNGRIAPQASSHQVNGRLAYRF